MTEHKYTDEEVIRALECCGSSYKGDTSARCSGCPLNEVGLEPAACFDTLLHDLSLDLINRQKEEIEGLIENFQRSIRADAKAGMSAGEILLHINNMLVELKKKYTEENK